MHRRDLLVGAAAMGLGACAAAATNATPVTPPPDAAERAETIVALRPPKRTRPVVAVLGSPHGAETTDLIVPYGVLRQSGLADVRIVSPTMAIMPLMPALSLYPQMDLAAFDAAWPEGADYVIVPAMHRDSDPAILAWIREQYERGALVCAICAGALVLSNAGLIAGRRATTHWYRIDELRRANPSMQWVRDRRYVVDRGVATTTGISASIPFALTLVEAIGGEAAVSAVAAELGVTTWNAEHDSSTFGLTGGVIWTATRNRAAFWNQERLGIEIANGVDEISLALAADAYSETYRSTAFAFANGRERVATRRGLELAPSSASGSLRMVDVPLDRPPARVLDAVLIDIAHRYGRETAAFAALNLEYAWRG